MSSSRSPRELEVDKHIVLSALPSRSPRLGVQITIYQDKTIGLPPETHSLFSVEMGGAAEEVQQVQALGGDYPILNITQQVFVRVS